MRAIFVLFLIWVSVAQSFHEKVKCDAFCSPTKEPEDIFREERCAVDVKIENKNATYVRLFQRTLSFLDEIIPQTNAVFARGGVDIEKRVASLRKQLAAVLKDPAVPIAESYQSKMLKFVQVIGAVIGRGATVLPKYYQHSFNIYKDIVQLLSAGLFQDVVNAYDLVEIYNAHHNPKATICACTKLRSFAKRGLGFLDAAEKCGNRYSGEIVTLSKATNALLVIGRDGVFAILAAGAGCFNNTARTSNSETKALLNTCLEVERNQFRGYNEIYNDLADSVYSYAEGKALLITDKFVTCMKTAAFGFVPSYLEYRRKYLHCVASNDYSIPSNLLDLVKDNDQLGEGYLLSDV